MNDGRDSGLALHEIGVFRSRQDAEAACGALLEAGFRPDDVNLFVQAPPAAETPLRAAKTDELVDTGGDVGAELGAAAGGIGGVLAGLGLIVVPGVGPMLALGPLAAAITGAITGGAVGGFAGSLLGLGVSEAEAIAAEHHMKAGRAVVIVQCGERRSEALAVLAANGALVVEPSADGAEECPA